MEALEGGGNCGPWVEFRVLGTSPDLGVHRERA